MTIPATETAQWRVLYDTVRHAEYGTSYTYAELNALAGVADIRDRRWIVHRTRTELLRHDRRYLAVERGVGYQIVQAEEHLRVGNDYRRKSLRQARNSVNVFGATDLSRIQDPVVRTAIIEEHTRMGRLEQELRRQGQVLGATVQITDGLLTSVIDNNDRLAAIEEKIRRMAGEGT